MTSTRRFVEHLVRVVPEIQTMVDGHIDAYGELLPHVFFGELTRWVVRNYQAETASQVALWRRLIDELELAYRTDDEEIRELVFVSFLENLPYPGEDGAEIVSQLGPSLAAALAEQR